MRREEKIIIDSKEKSIIQRILIYVRRYKEEKGRYPAPEKIQEKMELNSREFRNILHQLQGMGMTEKKISSFYLPKRPEKKHTTIPPIKLKDWKIFILKILIFFVGSVSFLLSVYFTFLWLNNMLSGIFSFLLSFSMVGFSIISFECVFLFYDQNKIFSFVFSLLWIVVLAFSMSTALAGQMSLERENLEGQALKNSEVYSTKIQYENYQDQIAQLQIDLDSLREERDTIQKFISQIDSFEESDYKQLNYRLWLRNQDVQKTRNKLMEIQEEKRELIRSESFIRPSEETTFYSWISGIFNVSEDLIQFLLFLAPAMFLDIIAPLSYSVILFYPGEKNENI